MPLSDHEQKLLDEIEQALYAEDPKFVSSVRSVRSHSRHRRAIVLCSLGILLGLGLVLVGLVTSIIALSVFGFVLVVASCGYAVQSLRERPSSPIDQPSPSRSSRDAHPSGLRTRMEDRLRRRFDEE
ncbi:MAG: DUF3040 domain-containing protein [Jatrophihabitantaceae bacterium]